MAAKQRKSGDRIERRLEELRQLRRAGFSDVATLELTKALDDKVNVIVAKAASIAAQWQLHSLLPQLLTAFHRLFENAVEADPQCWGKNAISQALKELGCVESAVFLRGLHHHQWEPVWGGEEDTAAVLRATCVLALAQCTDISRAEIMLHTVDTLTERDPRVRADGLRALEHMGGPDTVLLLRLKASAGDKEPRVTGQAFESLLALESSNAIDFVATFLRTDSHEVREEAALALGTSRLPDALELLLKEWKRSKANPIGPTLLRAISASRLEPAFEFLLGLVQRERHYDAESALLALELHRDTPEIVARIAESVSKREDLAARFRERFPSSS